jgi:predicted 3-demethylubiquinone-9 3-methyltransferase (glyoxalase superfamily)
MANLHKIVPNLWFDGQGEEAARFYVSVFEKDSRIVRTTHYTEAGHDVHKRPAGSVMTVEFDLHGQRFVALNGGPDFKFNEAISMQVMCDSQAEVDRFWEKLGEGGDPTAQQCGWLKDRFGLSWQIVPKVLDDLVADPDKQKAGRVMEAMLKMKKLDIAALERAYEG